MKKKGSETFAHTHTHTHTRTAPRRAQLYHSHQDSLLVGVFRMEGQKEESVTRQPSLSTLSPHLNPSLQPLPLK